LKERRAGGGDLLDVTVIRPAAPAHHVELRLPSLELRVLRAELDRVADEIDPELGQRRRSTAFQPSSTPVARLL
jgi:hypothetical protein